jgi:sulfur dioxygenase
MLFRQLLHKETSTYTYILADEDTKKAIIIDPVDEHVGQYLNVLNEYDLTLQYTLDTHVHADHITGSGLLREKTDCESVMHQKANIKCVSIKIEDNETLGFGNLKLKSIFTPGHTDHHTAFVVEDRLFTGDALLINGCGRTDFQNGSPDELWESIQNRLFTMPGETLVYPGHDYHEHQVSCIEQELNINPRFKGKSKEEFIDFMNNLNLPDPKFMMAAVPANERCGLKE